MTFIIDPKGHEYTKKMKRINEMRRIKTAEASDKAVLGPAHTINVKFSKDGFAISKSTTLAGQTKIFATSNLNSPALVLKNFKSLDEYIGCLKATIDIAFDNLQAKINGIDSQEMSDLEKDKAKWYLSRDYHSTIIETLRNVEKSVEGGTFKPFEEFFAKGGQLSDIVTFKVSSQQSRKSNEVISSRG